MAATIVTDDPVFGWTAFGGKLIKHDAGNIAVIPRDGLRTRLYLRSKERKLDLELLQDGFAQEQPIIIQGSALRVILENRSNIAHTATLLVNGTPHMIALPAGKTTPAIVQIN